MGQDNGRGNGASASRRGWNVSALPKMSRPEAARLSLAHQLFLKGRFAHALAEIGAVLRDNPALEAAHFIRGLVLLRQGEFAGACAALEAAVRLKPDHGAAWLVLGYAEIDLGRLDRALAAVDGALAADAADSNAHLLKGAVLELLDRHPEAMESYAAALRFNPQLRV